MVVGATRVLRPAVVECIGRGWTVVAIARSAADLVALAAAAGPRLVPLRLDVGDPAAVRLALTGSGLRDQVDDALVYYATDDDASENAAVDMVTPAVRGTTVRLLTSRWFPTGQPRNGPPTENGRWPGRVGRVHLLLGVQPAGTDPPWHDPQQISAAALEVLDRRQDAVLGDPPTRDAENDN